MKNSIILLIIILILISCDDKEWKNKGDKVITDSCSTISDIEGKFNFIKKFKLITKKRNLRENYNLDETKFKFIRQNMILYYIQREKVGFDKIKMNKSFLICDVYDNSVDAIRNTYGYIFLKNQFIMNVSKDAIYYLAWEDNKVNQKKSDIENNHYKCELINNNTKMLITNLDEELVRRTFNYKGPINKYKLDKVFLDYVTSNDQNSFNVVSKIYADSVSYNKYLKSTNKKLYE